jgi:hypothetical protein
MRKMAENFQEPINHVLDRRRKFNSLLDNSKDLGELGFTCPSCGYPTLGEREGYEICTLCGWEDDGQDDENADAVWGGPNGGISLNDSRHNFEINIKNFNEAKSEIEKSFASNKKRMIDCYERILVEADPIKRAAILKELPALYEEYGALLRQYVAEIQKSIIR